MARPAPTERLPITALAVIAVATLISVMNSSMSSVVLPEIRREFDVGPDALTWVVSAYLIPFATGTVVFGRLADIHGSRRLFVLGLALFAAGSLAVASAPSFPVIIGMRVAQGIGGAAVPAIGLITIIRATGEQRRGTSVGITILAVGLGFGLGPLVGGTLADAVGWQGPFLFTGVAAGIVTLAAVAWMPDVRGESQQKLDVIGTVILVVAVTGLVIALNRLPRDAGDALGLAGVALALPGAILLVTWLVTSTNPLIPGSVLRSTRFVPLAIVGFAAQGAHFAVIVLIPLLLEEFHQLSVIQIGLRIMPGAAALGFFGVFGGWFTRKVGERVLLIVGTWTMLSAALVFQITGVDFSTWNIGLTYLVLASGYGMVTAAALKAATDRLPEALTGVGTGVFNLFFFFGGAVSVAIAGAILRSRADAVEAWNPAFDGVAIAYSDAMVVVVVLSLAAFLVAVGLRPQARAISIPDENPASAWVPLAELDRLADQLQPGPSPEWAVKPRAKPITRDDDPRGAVPHGPTPHSQRSNR